MAESKYIELAKKLKALADKGVQDGERENAQKFLDQLMKKHGISREELEEATKNREQFNVSEGYRKKLFFQIVVSVLGNRWDGSFYHRGNTQKIFLDLTKAEAIEIAAKYDFYWRAYSEEQEYFFGAFVQKYRLVNPDGKGQPVEELDPEGFRKAIKVM